jgi:isopropylmalate/homocitrate/citramalate synthase
MTDDAGGLQSALEGVDYGEWENRFDSQDRWWVPYTTTLEVVRGTSSLPRAVTIFDSTLREGANVPGRGRLGVEDRVRILEALEEAGITEAEVGAYSYGAKEERESIAEAKKRGIKIRLAMHSAGWVKDYKNEIDRLTEFGVDMINFVLYGTSVELSTQPWLSPAAIPERSANLVEYAKQQGLFVGFGLSSSGRAHPLVEEASYKAAARAGADRLCLYDAVGMMSPEVVRYCMRRLRDYVGAGPELSFHCHNDVGLSTANSLAAVQGGATVLDATVNGFGQRGGITALEEIVTILAVMYGVDSGVDLSKLGSLSSLVEELYGVTVPADKPVLGRNLFLHESDAHDSAILAGRWYGWNTVKPETVGRKMILNIVPHCLHKGDHGAIAGKIRNMGVTVDDVQFDEILARLRVIMDARPKPLASEEELETVIREVAGG